MLFQCLFWLFQVTLKGIAKTPEELDDYYKNKGPIPSFSSKFGCIQDVVGYQANSSVLGKQIIHLGFMKIFVQCEQPRYLSSQVT